MRAAVALAVLALPLASGAARALTFEPGRTADGRPTLALQGPIRPGDAERFRAALARAPDVSLFVLNSPGGAVLDGRDIARTIRARGGSTLVPARAVCASACFLLFAAGREKHAEPGAMIGVHSASVAGGGENTSTLGTTTLMAREAAAYGVPAQITGRMVTTQPGQMAWLNRAELEAMGAVVDARAGGSGATVAPGSSGAAPSDWTAGFEAGRRGDTCDAPASARDRADWLLGCRSGARSGQAGVLPAATRDGAGETDWSRGFDAGRARPSGSDAALCASPPAGVGNAGEWAAGCRSGLRAGGGG
ncbi:MAG: hypothetical protein JOZ42_06375 [Acetobacteraceae bacterium]|nr:hypothetical protein [Acetobacteraceae bacterium]